MVYFKYKPIFFGLCVMLSSWKSDVKSHESDIKDYREGSNVVVVCNASKSEQVFWTNDQRQRWEGNVLNITNVTLAYEGLYTCVNQTSRDDIYSFFLNCLYPAHVVVINSSKHTINEKDTFWMYIQTIGSHDPVTTLVAISTGNVIFREAKEGFFNITMPSFNCSDTGLYALTCDNQLANNSKTESLSVWCSPEPNPNYQIVCTITPRLHDNVNLTLHATGYPHPSYEWYHNGTQLFNHTDTNFTTVLILNDISVQCFKDFLVVMKNSLENDSVSFSVKAGGEKQPPEPDPKYHLNTTYEPRLGDNVNLTIHALGFPEFHWSHNGTKIKSRDSLDRTKSEVFLTNITVDDFGHYLLEMNSSVGRYEVVYSVLAEGPPQPVSELTLSNVGTSSAQVNFITGYNYNRTQSFWIFTYNRSSLLELASCNDTTSGHGGERFKCKVENLLKDTLYIITVISRNIRGDSNRSSELTFTTYGKPKPDPEIKDTDTFKPRIPDNVTMTIHAVAYPPPKYDWWHKGSRLNSLDTNYTSSVSVRISEPEDFGKYLLNMTNEVGQFTKVYMLLAYGPPDPVSNLNVSNITQTSANITFISGYDYNDTQTFLVLNYADGRAKARLRSPKINDGGAIVTISLNELQPSSNYNITVVAMNSKGQSKPADDCCCFETLGKPIPDPSYKDNVTATPRLGANVTLLFHAVGNPLPSFQWYHDNKPLGNASTGNMTSLTINDFLVSDFGQYLLNMRNDLGETNVTFNVTAAGPPDPVTDLVAGEVTSDSVQLYWRPGFNYDSNQTFTIFQVGNDKELHGKIEDTTNGNFSMNETQKLTGLSSSTTYNVYVMAINEHGKASKYSNSVHFTTSGENQIFTTGLIIAVSTGILISVLVFGVMCYLRTETRTLTIPLEHDDMVSNGESENADIYGKEESKAVHAAESKIQDYGAVSGKRPETASSSGAVSGRRI